MTQIIANVRVIILRAHGEDISIQRSREHPCQISIHSRSFASFAGNLFLAGSTFRRGRETCAEQFSMPAIQNMLVAAELVL